MIKNMHLCSSSSFLFLLVIRQGFFLLCHIYVMDFFFPSFFFLSCSFMLDFSFIFIIYGIFYSMDFSFVLCSTYCSSSDESIPGVSHKDALMHLSMVRKYLEENFTEYNSYYDIEDMIEKNALINRTQSKITDFFK
jgi:hypothetical protein